MPRKKQIPICHPDRPYGALGLCRHCYVEQWRRSKGVKPKKKARSQAICHPERSMKAFELCDECYAKDYGAKNREKLNAKSATWQRNNRPLVTERERERKKRNPEQAKIRAAIKNKQVKEGLERRRQANPERIRRMNRKNYFAREYGITLERFDEMFEAQAGRCAACKILPCTVVDHNHATGEVRGLLCVLCNVTLGYCNENEGVLQGMIDYLRIYGANPTERKATKRDRNIIADRERDAEMAATQLRLVI